MAPKVLLLLGLLCFALSPARAALLPSQAKPCCESYTRSPVPAHRVVGFKEQRREENCRIDAIILITVIKREICVTIEDEWVKRILEKLSLKLKKMSKSKSDGKKTRKLWVHDGSGFPHNTTQHFNDSDLYY